MAEAVPGSFRDPAGSVFLREGVLYRQVNHVYQADYEALMGSGLYAALTEQGLLVRHQEVPDTEPLDGEALVVLRPDRVGFVSYPYEWCFSQLRDAGLVTLEAQRVALAHSMSLRDASAYNVQFLGGRPVLIDTLSFERLREGEPWVAYRQFCQHFLAPLALLAYRDLRLGRLSGLYIDGVPLDLAASLLPWRTRLRPSLFLHLHAHARSSVLARKHRARAREPRAKTRHGAGRFSAKALQGLVESLQRAVRGLGWRGGASEWSEYYAGDSYTDIAMAHKEELVAGFLEEAAPSSVWDLGANVGRFSRLASRRGIPTLAFDADPHTVELAYRQMRSEQEPHLLPLVLDLTNPSPAIGWSHRERASLVERGPAGLVMALALVHHLAIGNNLPLQRVAAFFRELAEWAIVEFIPKTDPKVELLLADREDVFSSYNQEQFERACSAHFTIEEREPINESERSLYLLRAR
jgi:hypothetical protein